MCQPKMFLSRDLDIVFGLLQPKCTCARAKCVSFTANLCNSKITIKINKKYGIYKISFKNISN